MTATAPDPKDDRRSAIRERILDWRQALDQEECVRLGDEIVLRALDLPKLAHASVICTYLSLPGEVPTAAICEWALGNGRRLVAPRVTRSSTSMTLHEVTDLEHDLTPGVWGIPAPQQHCPVVQPTSIDVAVVPGLAFDSARHRLGFGAGHYDRFLELAAPVTAIGLFFSAQRVPDCHPQPWDVPLDYIVTEREILS